MSPRGPGFSSNRDTGNRRNESPPATLLLLAARQLLLGAGPVVAGRTKFVRLLPEPKKSLKDWQRVAAGDALVPHGGTYSQNGRRVVPVKGTAERPLLSRADANFIAHAPA